MLFSLIYLLKYKKHSSQNIVENSTKQSQIGQYYKYCMYIHF